MYCRYITCAKKIIIIIIFNFENDLSRHFQKRWYRPFKFYSFKTYTSAFESAGIGTAYASAFKSAGIGLLNYIYSRPILAL